MAPVVRLDFGERITLDGTNAGSLQAIHQRLRHEPPTGQELEAAIADIEDRLMPALRSIQGSLVATSAREVKQIAAIVGAAGRLDTPAVEALFNRLADVANGRPASSLGFPADARFVAVLLFLRELLHHGRFESIALE